MHIRRTGVSFVLKIRISIKPASNLTSLVVYCADNTTTMASLASQILPTQEDNDECKVETIVKYHSYHFSLREDEEEENRENGWIVEESRRNVTETRMEVSSMVNRNNKKIVDRGASDVVSGDVSD